MLHSSLIDLAESAPLRANSATIRGVLADSIELLQNALNHGDSAVELAQWFSQLVSDVMHSPGVSETGATLVLTGEVGRGDALPTSTIQWFTVVNEATETDPSSFLEQLMVKLGLSAQSLGVGTREHWAELARSGKDPDHYLDAGGWLAKQASYDSRELLVDALNSRPDNVTASDGLPDESFLINIFQDLLLPTSKLARWAFPSVPNTLQRLNDAVLIDTLTEEESDSLQQVWRSGLELQSQRWMNHIENQETSAEEMPALQRSTYGAAGRMLSDVMYSVAARNNLSL